MGEFTRRPEWLRFALDLKDPELPNQLDTNTVPLVIDALNGGAAAASFYVVSYNKAGVVGLNTTTIVARSTDLLRVCYEFSVYAAPAHVTATTYVLHLRDIRLSTANPTTLRAASGGTPGAGGMLNSRRADTGAGAALGPDLGGRPIIIGPDVFSLELEVGATANAADDLWFSFLIGEFPAGSRPV